MFVAEILGEKDDSIQRTVGLDSRVAENSESIPLFRGTLLFSGRHKSRLCLFRKGDSFSYA